MSGVTGVRRSVRSAHSSDRPLGNRKKHQCFQFQNRNAVLTFLPSNDVSCFGCCSSAVVEPRCKSLEERVGHATLSITARHFCMSARKLEGRSVLAALGERARL
jgi:hypothetical protein